MKPTEDDGAGWPFVWRVIEHDGTSWEPKSRKGTGLRKRADKACFTNCVTHPRVIDSTYRYAEGLALSSIGPNDIWIHHAWLVDAENHAIDVTWPEPAQAYFGIAFAWDMTFCRTMRASYTNGHMFGGVLEHLAQSRTTMEQP